MTRTEALNKLLTGFKNPSYLEIGVGNGDNFNAIKAKVKKSVDPNGPAMVKQQSDAFFAANEDTYDLIFIDGDHRAEQVEKDIVNAYKALNPGGVVVLHDVHPRDEAMQAVPRRQTVWTGDVWKTAYGFIKAYNDQIKIEYIEEKYGLLAIYKAEGVEVKPGFTDTDLTYSDDFKGYDLLKQGTQKKTTKKKPAKAKAKKTTKKK